MSKAGGGSRAVSAHDPERGVSSPYMGQSLVKQVRKLIGAQVIARGAELPTEEEA